MTTLQDAFEHTLRDIYLAENATPQALPNVSKAAQNPDMKAAIDAHLKATKGHVKTLDQVFESLGMKPEGETYDAMTPPVRKADEVTDEASATALDVSLIGAAQAVKHYEIARYGTLREWAKVLGHDKAHELLSSILHQKKAANTSLTALAVSEANRPANPD